MSTIAVVGNPKPLSRTRSAAELVVERLTGAPPDRVVDVVDLGAGLLGWGDPAVADAVAAVRSAEVAVVASPTYKATYTGLLKLFLDQIGTGDLAGVVAVPLMLGGGPTRAPALTVEFHWFLPTRGDSRDVGPATTDRGHNAAALRRRPTLGYLTGVAQAAEQSGFTAVLTPTGSGCEDAWVVCAAVAAVTERLEFLVAFRPGFVLPTLAAQQAATFQQLTGNRLRLNIVTGGDPVEQRAYGDFLDHDARYARTGEFLEVLRRSFDGERFDFAGDHVRVEGAGLAA